MGLNLAKVRNIDNHFGTNGVSWQVYVQKCFEVHAYVRPRSTSWLECRQLTLGISMLLKKRKPKCQHLAPPMSTTNKIFPLHTKTQTHHLKYPNYYGKCNYFFTPKKKTLMLMNSIIMATTIVTLPHDTLRPLLGIWWGHLQIVHRTLNAIDYVLYCEIGGVGRGCTSKSVMYTNMCNPVTPYYYCMRQSTLYNWALLPQ